MPATASPAPTEAPQSDELKQAHELIEILRSENEHLRVDLANIQQNLAGSVEFNQQSTELCRATEGVFTELADEFRQVNARISDQSRSVSESRQLVDKASEELKAVSSAAESIKDLADQTNLLALNAQIEAARAGQAGAGFSIVAQEVKCLSQETDKATQLIEESVKAIEQTSRDISERMRMLETTSEDIKTRVDQFDDSIHQTQGRNTETLHRVSNCTDRIFISLAKLDHTIWKVNTYRSLVARKPLFEFVDCHHCRLGKWYYKGDGQKSFSLTPSFGKLALPHSVVHNATKKLFDLLEISFDTHACNEVLTEMEQASEGVFSMLDQILSEKK